MGESHRSVSLRTQKEYARRINAALDYIDRNIADDISLDKLAAVACFSPYHFHRIFSAFVGEPPAEYVRRLRLEKAAILLVNEASTPVTTIALSCGFSTSALFSRLFKARFGMTPTAWRAGGYEKRKNGQEVRKVGKDGPRDRWYRWSERARTWERRTVMTKKLDVRIEDVPPWRVAYVKHMKGYEDSAGIGDAFQTLFCWAGPRGVMGPDMRVLGLALDNPDITPKDKCRYYAGVVVNDRAEPDGRVGIMTIRPGKYAVGRFSGGAGIFKKAYAEMYGEWLPGSGWQPDDSPAFESYIGEPSGTEKRPHFVFDLYVPVKPL
ncbi:MAG: AraC family transcriptional regulator [Candidatus Aminicenantes bacterium]|nr:MAG: AraC family transcriptional regulator [Candidatus Aminicenantes bacterium]